MSVALHDIINDSASSFSGLIIDHLDTINQLTVDGRNYVVGLAHTIAALESLQRDDR